MKTINMLLAGAVVATVAGFGATQVQAEEKAAETEKCYGVVKAGQNDCANASKSHSCAGHAAADGDAGEWISLPKGVCEKLVNGTLETAAAEGDAAAPAAQ